MSKRPTPPPAKGRKTPPSASPQPPITDDWLTLGKIVASFGLLGEVKLLAETDFPDRLAERQTLYLGADHRPYALERARQHGGVILLKFRDIPTIDAAEKLRGQVVMIPASEAAPLAPDQYYIHDLIGLRALHVNGAELGVIADVITGAAQDILVIRHPLRADVLVPMVKVIVPQVDLAARTVTIDPPAGLFDDDFEQA